MRLSSLMILLQFSLSFDMNCGWRRSLLMWTINHHIKKTYQPSYKKINYYYDRSRSLFHKADVSGGLDCYQVKMKMKMIIYEYYDHMSIMIITQNLCRERRHSTSRPGSGTRQRTPSPPWATSTESRWTSNQHDLNEKYDSLRNCTALCQLFGDTSLNDVRNHPFIGDHIYFHFYSFICAPIFCPIPILWLAQ